jgi:hypothetical protein
MARRLPHSLFCLIHACIGLPGGALAAELGDARVVSHIGQQLVADIELTALHDETAPVQVRLASADVYRGAGIAMPPVLSGLSLSVMRRAGRQFLHVTSQGPVQSDYLHLYLELADGNERAVRLATLWLTPDPNPASLAAARPVQPAAAPELKPVPKAPPEPEPKPSPALVDKPGAASVPKPAPKPAAKPVPAPAAQAGAVQALKPAAPVNRIGAPAAKAVPPIALAPSPRSTMPPAAWASCARPDPALLRTCVALDYKNARLTSQIGQLEDKVKLLQLAMGATPAADHVVPAKAGTHAEPLRYAASAMAASRAPESAKPAARVVAKPAQARQPPEPSFPWLWLALGGTVLLAGAGATVFVVLRRKAEQERKAKAMKASLSPIMSGVKNRLVAGKGAPAGADAPADATQE